MINESLLQNMESADFCNLEEADAGAGGKK